MVKHLTALTSLNMSETNVSDAELAAVGNLRNMREFFVGKTKISSAGKSPSKSLPSLPKSPNQF